MPPVHLPPARRPCYGRTVTQGCPGHRSHQADLARGATFSGGALVLGAVIHMMMSIVMGLVLALLVYGAKPGPAVLLVGGMMYGIGLWLFNHYAIWTAIDEIAAEAFTPWVFAVGHLMYGVVAAGALLPALRSPAIQQRTAA